MNKKVLLHNDNGQSTVDTFILFGMICFAIFHLLSSVVPFDQGNFPTIAELIQSLEDNEILIFASILLASINSRFSFGKACLH